MSYGYLILKSIEGIEYPYTVCLDENKAKELVDLWNIPPPTPGRLTETYIMREIQVINMKEET